MNISGIRPSEGFYSYNSIRVNELRNSQIMSSKQAVDDTASQQSIADDTDLDKDKVLQQYQRFVGSADVTVMQQAALNEQINRETENFIL